MLLMGSSAAKDALDHFRNLCMMHATYAQLQEVTWKRVQQVEPRNVFQI